MVRVVSGHLAKDRHWLKPRDRESHLGDHLHKTPHDRRSSHHRCSHSEEHAEGDGQHETTPNHECQELRIQLPDMPVVADSRSSVDKEPVEDGL
eukprot:CAMPEP_0180544738 /NCGR_PEP_ID=MMETSP1036_2-20121128/69667_1 /TAXON_ID=632150 /ORGANISM="Azadinium spinosum, Strain 3D9" /LENGTH=93 /DNA_ID=CAMNT_0022559735 /DNA_START=86 /DNA_END=367 /DNA_ORIENTATION=+